MSADIPGLSETAAEERPLYFEAAKATELVLKRAMRDAGLRGDVTARAKEVDQIVKKAIRKGYANPLEDIKDRAGARIVLTYEYQVAEAVELVRTLFVVDEEEDKHETLAANELGYLGYHLDCRLPKALIPEKPYLAGLRCEIQIHTRMQSVWAEVSHELIYKARPEPPSRIMRRILRLQPFVELFDEEVTRAREQILALPGKEEARALQHLDRHFYRLAGVDFDEELSLQVLSSLLDLYDDQDRERLAELVRDFVERNEDKLRQLFDSYRSARGEHPLLFQPEALIVFERLEHDEFQLADQWEKDFPLTLLESLSTVWGKPIASIA